MRSVSGSKTLANKVSSFFEKAMEALGVDEEELTPSPIDQDLSESFMATFGTQVQTTYMLRLLVTHPEHLFHLNKTFSEPEDLAMRAQVLSTLYKKNLTGFVVLLRKSEIEDYLMGKIYSGRPLTEHLTSDNEAWHNRMKSSTELHFDSFETQWREIRSDIEAKRGSFIVEEGMLSRGMNLKYLFVGDVFVTRHSNLFGVHVLFHLIVDETPQDIDSRSPVLKGLRHILQISHEYSVQNITFQLPLLSSNAFPSEEKADPSRPNRIESLIFRRSESTLKVTKAFLSEYHRALKHSGSAIGRSSTTPTIQFLLPPSADKNIRVSMVFQSLKDKVAEIFRVV